MARTLEEIKEGMEGDLMRNTDAARLYGFTAGVTEFGKHFGKLSVEGLLFYIVAMAVRTLERLFDLFRADTERMIDEKTPHRPKWYRDKALSFMKGRTLVADTDRYDTSGMTDEAVEAARVVRYAAATEPEDASVVTLKVAGESGGRRGPLDGETEAQLRAYIAEVKDAGVKVQVVNKRADRFTARISVWYDPVLLEEDVRKACAAAVRAHVENLPFNGEYTDMGLVDTLQGLEGVKIADVVRSAARGEGEATDTVIEGRFTPAAGYFEAADVEIDMKAY